MSELDLFAHQLVTPTLQSGEVILVIGCAEEQAEAYGRTWLLVGTSQRLVAIETRRSVLQGGPTADLVGVESFAYAQLSEVRTATGITALAVVHTRFVIFGPQGVRGGSYLLPHRARMVAKPNGHALFHDRYVPWLLRFANAGAFRSPDGCAAAANEWSSYQANDAARANAAAAASRKAPVRAPLLLLLPGLAVAGLGAAMTAKASTMVEISRSSLARYRENPRAPEFEGVLPNYGDELTESVKLHESRVAQGVGAGLAGLAVGASGVALSVVLTRRKRARNAAAPTG